MDAKEFYESKYSKDVNDHRKKYRVTTSDNKYTKEYYEMIDDYRFEKVLKQLNK